MIHHSEDYKLSTVKYYLKNKNKKNIRNTCKLFDCKYQSLSRWIRRYNTTGNIRRKTRVNKNIKITKNIEKYVKDYIKQYSTTTLLELSKLVKGIVKVLLMLKSTVPPSLPPIFVSINSLLFANLIKLLKTGQGKTSSYIATKFFISMIFYSNIFLYIHLITLN